MILTSVDKVAIDYGKPDEMLLHDITLSQARKYYDEGHFPPGSMGPKIRAAMQFIQDGGKEVIITSIENAGRAFDHGVGTRIRPD